MGARNDGDRQPDLRSAVAWIRNVEGLLRALGIDFRDPTLYARALTHSSFANEAQDDLADNERLEFLGDAVIELVVSARLFAEFSGVEEGQLTRMRAALVCEPTLAACATRVGLGEHLRLGKGEEESGGRQRPSLLSDAFEAFAGAMYLDTGFGVVRDFVLSCLDTDLVRLENCGELLDAKGLLQAWYQAALISRPSYRVVDDRGPDHNKTYIVEVELGNKAWGRGVGGSKKAAEKAAAGDAIAKLRSAGIVGSASSMEDIARDNQNN